MGEEIGSLEGGKAADLVVWRRPDVAARSRTGRRPTWSGRSSSAAGSSSTSGTEPAALGLAARLQEDRRRLGRQARDRDRQLRLRGRDRRPSRGRTSRGPRRISGASSSSGIATTIRGSSCATSSAAFVAESGPPIGTQAMSTGPMSASFSSVRRWPISPRWIVWSPSSSTRNATCLPRSAPLASSRYVRTPGQQDVVDLVLAGSVEDERVVERARQERRARRAIACPWPWAAACRRGGST